MASDFSDPRSALAEIERARSGVSRRVASPVWFHLGLGALVAQQAIVSGLAGGNDRALGLDLSEPDSGS